MTTQPIRILFISHRSDWGGAQNCLYLLLKGLDRSQFEPLVVLPREGVFRDKLQKLGIRTIISEFYQWIGIGVEKKFSNTISASVDRLVSVIRDESIDIVFTNTSVVVDGAIAASLCQVPHIWHVLEMLSSDPVLIPFIELPDTFSILNLLSSQIIAVSIAVKKDIQRFVLTNKIKVIHTGFDAVPTEHAIANKLSLFGVHQNTPIISFVGELSKRKGILTLIDAVPRVLSKKPEARFVIVGRDAGEGVEAEIKQKIEEYQIEQAVSLLGFREDVPAILDNSDIFVLSSLSDPLPVVVLEAMAHHLPVIATRSGGAEEMVSEGETGLLVPPNDAIGMSGAILKLLSEPEHLQVLGRAGKARLNAMFSYKKSIEEFENLFLSTVAQKPPVHSFSTDTARLLIPLLKNSAEQKTQAHSIERLETKVQNLESQIQSTRHSFPGKLYRASQALVRKLMTARHWLTSLLST
jgi:glycosyltransferase involved in cell wall biosynthesis